MYANFQKSTFKSKLRLDSHYRSAYGSLTVRSNILPLFIMYVFTPSITFKLQSGLDRNDHLKEYFTGARPERDRTCTDSVSRLSIYRRSIFAVCQCRAMSNSDINKEKSWSFENTHIYITIKLEINYLCTF